MNITSCPGGKREMDTGLVGVGLSDDGDERGEYITLWSAMSYRHR